MLTIKTDYPLKSHNTFGLDVKAKYFVEYENTDDLREFLAANNYDTRHMVHIGSGSDILFTKDYDGHVLHSAVKGIEKLDEREGRVLLSVGSAEIWDDFVVWTLSNGYYGLENLSLIPSEVGASAVQNIGAYGAEVKDFIVCVDCVDMRDGMQVRHMNGDCGFNYRNSNFKGSWRGRYAITNVIFSLYTEFKPNIKYNGLKSLYADKVTAEDVRNKVIELRRSKLPEPSEIGNAGSFFLNPVVSAKQYASLQKLYPDIPHYPANDAADRDRGDVKVPAAWLIERAGWKGKSMGRAAVYERQPLVLVNLGGATPDEIVNLAKSITIDVRQKFGIVLRPEVIYI